MPHDKGKSLRATMQDVAIAAGVGVATVDRVLNSRAPVREATAWRVLEAAQRVGYHGAALMQQRLLSAGKGAARTLGFILQINHDAFYTALAQALHDAAAAQTRWRCRVVVRVVDALKPADMVDAMHELAKQVDGLGVVAGDHPLVNQAVTALRASGCPTVALLSDLSAPDRVGYVGLDHRKTGRTAAWCISRGLAQPAGEVAVLVGSHRFIGHELTEMSLRSYLREHVPDVQVLESMVSREDAAQSYEATLAILGRHPDLVGLYLPGGGTEGAIHALQEAATQGQHVVTVATELTEAHRVALQNGLLDMVIGTPRRALADAAISLLCESLDDEDGNAIRVAPRLVQLPFELQVPESV